MPTINVDEKTYALLKKLSSATGVPIKKLVSYFVMEGIKNMEKTDELYDLPPELVVEAMYWRIVEAFRMYRMAKRIKYWAEQRLEDLRLEEKYESWRPLKILIRKYIEKLEDAYEQLEKKIRDEGANVEEEEQEVEEIEVVED